MRNLEPGVVVRVTRAAPSYYVVGHNPTVVCVTGDVGICDREYRPGYWHVRWFRTGEVTDGWSTSNVEVVDSLDLP